MGVGAGVGGMEEALEPPCSALTLVNPAALQIRVDLPETALQRVQVGGSGTATPKAFADRKLPVTVKSVSQVPQSNGKHDCVLSVKLGKQQPAVMPGMSCEVELIASARLYAADSACILAFRAASIS